MTYKKCLFFLSVVLLMIIIVIGIIIPMFRIDRTPGWGEDGNKFLYGVNKALQKYSLSHENKMPSTLSLLYPEYIDDKRVIEQTPLFAGQKMAIIYWCPQKLGDAGTPVAQIVLDPGVKTSYRWRSFVLWGDGKVRHGQKY
ncbi:MAG: hypothetical protein FJ263_08720 [Planctomycetes bacterium]|nr:hypothetical protein [Planctomycetota bacterium]